MSQKIIYDLLKELGGNAFTSDISKLAKQKYPDATLHTYVYHRLRDLKKWGLIKKNTDGSWSIVEEYPRK